jgi:hypothetical protein
MSDADKLFSSLDMIECGRLYNQARNCFEKATNKQAKEECFQVHKKYQYCVAQAESERLNQAKYWQEFKEKWGHYPNEVQKDS